MPYSLNSKQVDFAQKFDAFLTVKRDRDQNVDAVVHDIIMQVRDTGDDALRALTQKFDQYELPADMCFSRSEMDAAITQVPNAQKNALELAAQRIRAYHSKQRPSDHQWQGDYGETLGWRWRAIATAGLYVPGGVASYPSSVLMNAIPAQVAGVRNLMICAPTPKGQYNPLVLLAARLAGVEKIYRIGGAQAIAAMAYGTQTIQKVDVITGPGNAYVATAKRQVYGMVGIDMVAGPSEILIIADAHNNPDWIALDMLSQAEHDTGAQAILITDNADFAQKTQNAIQTHLQTLERRDIASASWRDFGAIIVLDDLQDAVTLCDRIAPEHLQICAQNAQQLCDQIQNAGAIFIGAYSPEAIGDYIAGPNHVLPTSGSARFASGLSVFDFMKRTTIQTMTPAALSAIGPAGETLAESENLQAHGLSIRARLNHLNSDDTIK